MTLSIPIQEGISQQQLDAKADLVGGKHTAAQSRGSTLTYNPATGIGILTGADGATSTIDLSGKADKNNDLQNLVAYRLSLGRHTSDFADNGKIYLYDNANDRSYSISASDTSIDFSTNIQVTGQVFSATGYVDERLLLNANLNTAHVWLRPLTTNLHSGTSISGDVWMHSTGLFCNSNGTVVGPLTGTTTNAALLTSGTLADARLSSNVALLSNNLAGLANVATARSNLGLATIAATGSASDLGTGTLPDARLSTNVVTLTGTQTLTNKTLTSPTTSGNIVPNANLTGSVGTSAAYYASGFIWTMQAAQYLLTNNNVNIDANGLAIRSGGYIALASSANVFSGLDTYLYRDAANVWAQRNGANAQTFRVYGNYTDGSNYIRGAINCTSSQLTLGAEVAGTSSAANMDLLLLTKNAGNVGIGSATFTPARSLHIQGGNTAAVRIDRSSGVPFVLLSAFSDATYATCTQSWSFGGGGGSDFLINDLGTAVGGTGTTRLRIVASTGATTASVNAASASGTDTMFQIIPAINQSGTAGYTALLISATETTVGSGLRTLFEGRVNGNGVFRIDQAGSMFFGSGYTSYISSSGLVLASAGITVPGTATNALNVIQGNGANPIDIRTVVSQPITFKTNNVTRLTLAATGEATFTSHVTSTFGSQSADPTTTDLTAGQCRIVKNTTSLSLRLWANDGGTIKSVALT